MLLQMMNAIAVIAAVADHGNLLNVPAMFMDKIAVEPEAVIHIDYNSQLIDYY